MSEKAMHEALRKHLKDLADRGGLQPGLAAIEIRHDDDCPRLTGGECDCDPEIESGARIARKYPV